MNFDRSGDRISSHLGSGHRWWDRKVAQSPDGRRFLGERDLHHHPAPILPVSGAGLGVVKLGNQTNHEKP